MAKQESIIEIKGTIGKLSFYKTEDGYMIRKKTSLSKERIAKDPAYARTRETMDMFAKAGAAGKLLRDALRPIAVNTSDSRVISRLSKQMTKVIKADSTNPRGKKNVLDGETELLTGFEFNARGKLSSTLIVTYESSIDRASGTVQVKLPSFVPDNKAIASPFEATHFQLHMAGVEVDFERAAYVAKFKSSDQLVLNGKELAAFDLSVALPPSSTHPLFLALGIEFFMEDVDGNKPLNNGAFNALAIIKVSGV
ncbi:hypothetical protein FAM09_23455 [Niastella caeni]|uniref:Uncharacterized protein n=1 Tax=Niastella caeni TaxID=2569763 RepID=A0A4S8HKR9_9BACT|nr:hypothetical protein [Niastella caeni]THU34949.1 hypothetical protein FAM09_23455 [Niastella caeni]